jgi:hypothetical protein
MYVTFKKLPNHKTLSVKNQKSHSKVGMYVRLTRLHITAVQPIGIKMNISSFFEEVHVWPKLIAPLTSCSNKCMTQKLSVCHAPTCVMLPVLSSNRKFDIFLNNTERKVSSYTQKRFEREANFTNEKDVTFMINNFNL